MSCCDSLLLVEKYGWTSLQIMQSCQSKGFAVVSDIKHKIFVVSDQECEVNCMQPWLNVGIIFNRAKILVNMKQYLTLDHKRNNRIEN